MLTVPITNPSSLVTPRASGDVSRSTSMASRLPTPATRTPHGMPATIRMRSRSPTAIIRPGDAAVTTASSAVAAQPGQDRDRAETDEQPASGGPRGERRPQHAQPGLGGREGGQDDDAGTGPGPRPEAAPPVDHGGGDGPAAGAQRAELHEQRQRRQVSSEADGLAGERGGDEKDDEPSDEHHRRRRRQTEEPTPRPPERRRRRERFGVVVEAAGGTGGQQHRGDLQGDGELARRRGPGGRPDDERAAARPGHRQSGHGNRRHRWSPVSM